MKKQLRILNLLGRKFDLSLFYCITYYHDRIVLQGYFTREVNEVLQRLELKGEVNSIGYVEYNYKNIQIILTPCSK